MALLFEKWKKSESQPDSNQQPSRYHSDALTTELWLNIHTTYEILTERCTTTYGLNYFCLPGSQINIALLLILSPSTN